MTQKIYPIIDNFFVIIKFFFVKKHIQYNFSNIFNVFILFNTVSYLKFNLKLKINGTMRTFKNLEEILKTWKKI